LAIEFDSSWQLRFKIHVELQMNEKAVIVPILHVLGEISTAILNNLDAIDSNKEETMAAVSQIAL
jgi:hypothetical protein